MSLSDSKSLRKIMAAVAGALTIAFVAFALFGWHRAPPPPANGELVSLVKFVNSARFESLADTDKMPYMKRMRTSSAELKKAFTSGSITKKEFEEASLNGWMARQLDHMQEYYSTPAANRNKLLQARYAPKPGTTSAAQAAEHDEPDNDTKDAFIHDRIRTWPVEQREQWETYRAAAKAAKSAATRPSGK